MEEVEEKMKNRRKTADGYQRWMMKAANSGAAAFGELEQFDDKDSGVTGGKGCRKINAADYERNVSDQREEEEGAARKKRLNLKIKSGDDDEEGPRGGDLDFDDDDIEKGDDWEHEEIFTDDDEAVGDNPEDCKDLAHEVPAPAEIKQSEEDEDEDNEDEGGLSTAGKELNKLLGRTGGLNESDAEVENDGENIHDISVCPVQALKMKDALEEEPVDSSPSKPSHAGIGKGTLSNSKSATGKRKLKGGDDTKTWNAFSAKKTKKPYP